MPGVKLYKRSKSFAKKRELRKKVIAMERELVSNRAKLENADQKAQHIANLEAEVKTLKTALTTVIKVLPATSRKKIPAETKGMLGIKER